MGRSLDLHRIRSGIRKRLLLSAIIMSWKCRTPLAKSSEDFRGRVTSRQPRLTICAPSLAWTTRVVQQGLIRNCVQLCFIKCKEEVIIDVTWIYEYACVVVPNQGLDWKLIIFSVQQRNIEFHFGNGAQEEIWVLELVGSLQFCWSRVSYCFSLEMLLYDAAAAKLTAKNGVVQLLIKKKTSSLLLTLLSFWMISII